MPWVFLENPDSEYDPTMCQEQGTAWDRIEALSGLIESEIRSCEFFHTLTQMPGILKSTAEDLFEERAPYLRALRAVRKALDEAVETAPHDRATCPLCMKRER